jgi:hypothetical protein
MVLKKTPVPLKSRMASVGTKPPRANPGDLPAKSPPPGKSGGGPVHADRGATNADWFTIPGIAANGDATPSNGEEWIEPPLVKALVGMATKLPPSRL